MLDKGQNIFTLGHSWKLGLFVSKKNFALQQNHKENFK